MILVAAFARPALAQSDDDASPDSKTAVTELSVSPTTLSYSVNLDKATSETKHFILTNTGTLAAGLNVTVGAPAGGDAGDYTVSGPGLTAAGGTITIPGRVKNSKANIVEVDVAFAPTAAGRSLDATILVTNTGTKGKPSDTIKLNGSALAASGKLQKPTHLSFGKQVVNTSSQPKTVTITNPGSAPIAIQSVAAAGDFIEADSCVGVLAPKGGCTISIAFRPTATGNRSGALTITDNAKGSPQKIKLSGVGQGAIPVTAEVASLPGSSTSDLVAVSPLSEAPVGTDPSSATFQTSPNNGQAVGIIDMAREFGWMAVFPGWLQQSNPQIGPLSTAVYYVFMVPGIFTDDPSAQSATLSALANLTEVQTLADALENNASGGNPMLVPDVQTAYQQAVVAGLAAIGSLASRPEKVSDLTLSLEGSEKRVAAASDLAVSYKGPVALNENYAKFVVNGASATGVTVNPQWLPATFGVGQGLYWIAAVYGVDTDGYYTSFDDFSSQFDLEPFNLGFPF